MITALLREVLLSPILPSLGPVPSLTLVTAPPFVMISVVNEPFVPMVRLPVMFVVVALMVAVPPSGTSCARAVNVEASMSSVAQSVAKRVALVAKARRRQTEKRMVMFFMVFGLFDR